MIDLFVAFTLLVTAMAVVTPLVVRHGRLLQSQRHYRLALEELTNQMDWLTVLPSASLPQAVEQLKVSTFAQERLNGVAIKGELTPAEGGQRITLRLSWNEPGRRDAPLTLAGWNFSRSALAADEADGGQP